MVVYVEYLLFNNFMMDVLLAYLVRRFLGGKKDLWRIILSAVIGTGLVFPFLYIKLIWLAILYKITVLLLCCAPLGQTLRQFAASLVLYTLFSASVAGLVYLFGNTTIHGAVALTNSGALVGLLSLAGIVAVYLVCQLKGVIGERKQRKKMRRIVLVAGEKHLELTAYLDSGNTARDGRGEGVLVLSNPCKDLLQGRSPYDNIMLSTIHGKAASDLYKLDTMVIYGDKLHTYSNVSAVVADIAFKGYDALLSAWWED